MRQGKMKEIRKFSFEPSFRPHSVWRIFVGKNIGMRIPEESFLYTHSVCRKRVHEFLRNTIHFLYFLRKLHIHPKAHVLHRNEAMQFVTMASAILSHSYTTSNSDVLVFPKLNEPSKEKYRNPHIHSNLLFKFICTKTLI